MISKRSPSHPFPSIQLIVTFLISFLYRCKDILMEVWGVLPFSHECWFILFHLYVAHAFFQSLPVL